MIRLAELTKRYGKFTAVDAIDLHVPRGELFGLLGPNGAGKTTTMRMIAGILRPTSGSITCRRASTSWPDPLAAKAQAGLHPRPAVRLRQAHRRRVPPLRGRAVRAAGRGGGAADRRAAGAVRARAVEGRADRELQPRHAAEAHHLRAPSCTGPRSSWWTSRWWGSIPRAPACSRTCSASSCDRGGTVLMSTHTLEVAEVMCDRIAIVYRGKVAAQGTMAELREQTASGEQLAGGHVPQAHRRPPGASARFGLRGLRWARRAATQPGLWTLLVPKRRGGLARLRQQRSGSWPKVLLLGAGRRGVLDRHLRHRLPGAAATSSGWPTSATSWRARCSSVILLAFLAILLLSNVITALSTFFLAKDLDLLVAAPVGWVRLYLAKLSETMVHSSWMVVLLALPILSAYGIVYHGGPLFPLVALGAFLPFLVLPAVIGVDRHQLLLVNVFPGAAHAGAARPDRDCGGRGRGADPAPGDSAGAAGPARGIPELRWTTSWCCARRPARSCRASGPPP